MCVTNLSKQMAAILRNPKCSISLKPALVLLTFMVARGFYSQVVFHSEIQYMMQNIMKQLSFHSKCLQTKKTLQISKEKINI